MVLVLELLELVRNSADERRRPAPKTKGLVCGVAWFAEAEGKLPLVGIDSIMLDGGLYTRVLVGSLASVKLPPKALPG